jgi:pyridoxal phosphate enzyme (YggS family)
VDSLETRLHTLRERIGRACDRSGRDPSEVTLQAVTKFHPPSTVAALAALGVTCFGESRVQEARTKIPLCPNGLEWHLIGHLQTNKCRDAVRLFHMVEGVDRWDVALELQRHAEQQSKTLPILLEVNVAGESSKFGWSPATVQEAFPKLLELDRLEIHGLMTIAPHVQDPERARPWFRQLNGLRGTLEQQLGAPLSVLSMGMSGDLEIAIEEGSTLVRVGTALAGPRPPLRSSAPDGP